MELTEELTLPGLRLRHPKDVEVETRSLETRGYRIHRVEVTGPWLASRQEEGVGARCRVRAVVFETLDGSPTGDLLQGGHVPGRTGRHKLEPGEFAGHEARLRPPTASGDLPRAAYVAGKQRFFFVEWRGPAGEILDTLELDDGC